MKIEIYSMQKSSKQKNVKKKSKISAKYKKKKKIEPKPQI